MQVLNISAQPGQPSTFWQGKSGRWYRTKNHAISDKEEYAVNPDDYAIGKSWFQRNPTLVALIVVTLIISLIIYLAKK